MIHSTPSFTAYISTCRILTNGHVWQVWHLTAGLPVVLDLALEVNLLGEGGLAQKADTLVYLSKDAFRRRLIDELWHAKAATCRGGTP